MTAETPKRVCLGQVAGAHGIRGEVRIRTFTEAPEAVADYGPLQDAGGTRTLVILSARPAKTGAIARIEGVASREDAEALRGTELWVDRAALPEQAGDGSYYHADLIGLVALSADGAALGQVVAVHNFGAGDLLEVRPATGGDTVLVPFTEQIVPDIDLQAGWMLMLPPEGIFED
jgi:16S rRNA processing protein RimM